MIGLLYIIWSTGVLIQFIFCNKIFHIEVLSGHFFDDKVRLAFEDVQNVKLVILQGTGVYAKMAIFKLLVKGC